MKRKSLTLTLTLVVFLTTISICAGSWVEVVIDPGHGGPGASKFGNNGGGYNNGKGSIGPDSQLTEQWVNLQVAFLVRDSINTFWGGDTGWAKLTRTTEIEDIDLWYRVNFANYANGTSPANAFISIHHNGLPLNTQGTEVWWSSTSVTDSIYWRAYDDSILAEKINSRIVTKWRYWDRCAYPRSDASYKCTFCCNDCCYRPGGTLTCCYQDSISFVLRNTTTVSALSEASNLKHVVEESLFMDISMTHIKEEAAAIYEGWYSWCDEAGIAIVKNGYIGGDGQSVVIGDWTATLDSCFNGQYYPSPYSACWLADETYCLEADPSFFISPYSYFFHHWTHLDKDGGQTGEDYFGRVWNIMVPSIEEYHRYVAYYKGGPFYAKLNSPNGGEVWGIGETKNIYWDANTSYGADSTAVVDVYLDRHNGSTGYPEVICQAVPRKYWGYYSWTVTGPTSDSCRIKIVVHDVADNQAVDISNSFFAIKGPSVTLTSPNGGENWEAGSIYPITWNSFLFPYPVKISYTKDGDSTWTTITSWTANDGYYDWTLPNSPYIYTLCRIRIEESEYGIPSDESNSFFTITAGPLSPPAIFIQRDCYEYIPGILISWEDNNLHELGYKIERRDSTSNWQEIDSVGINGKNFRNRNLIGSEIYFYRIRAYNQARYSSFSNEVFIKSPPSLPSNFTGYVYTGPDFLNQTSGAFSESALPEPPPEEGDPTNAVVLKWNYPLNQKLPITYYRIVEQWYGSGWEGTRVIPVYGYSDTLCPLFKDFSYYFYVYAVDSDGDSCSDCRAKSSLLHTGVKNACPSQVDKLVASLPEKFSLSQNFPNPFNPQTEIKLGLPEPSFVKLEIYNILGHLVKILVNQNMEAGFHKIIWNSLDKNNKEVSSGIYFYKIQAGNFTEVKKMILIR